jgi:uncharacterized RDD family membrane protein YckC
MTDQANPVTETQSQPGEELEYVGFWPRLGASIIDSILAMMIVYPLLYFFYGGEYFTSEKLLPGLGDFILTHVLPAVAIVIFWIYRSATPGKMAIRARIVDAGTGGHPTTRQLIIRYLAYYLSTIPLFLGFLWIAWDPKKQGWHDKLAHTVVVRPKGGTTQKVAFPNEKKPEGD